MLGQPFDGSEIGAWQQRWQFVDAGQVAAGQGNWNLVQTLETAADVSLRIAAEPEGQRSAMTERFVHKGVKHDITVDPNAADPFASFKDHSKGQDAVGAIIEGVAGVVLNVLAVIPVTAPVAAPLAVAWDTAQAGKSFAEGNVLGGFLSLASAAGVGLVGLDAASQGAGAGSFAVGAKGITDGVAGSLGFTATATGSATQALGQTILSGAALVGGASGIAQSAASGDPLGIAAGALEVAAAVAGGLVSTHELTGSAGEIAGKLAAGAGLASVAVSSADAFAHGDLAGGLASSLNALLPLIAQNVAKWSGAGQPAAPAPPDGYGADGLPLPVPPDYASITGFGMGEGSYQTASDDPTVAFGPAARAAATATLDRTFGDVTGLPGLNNLDANGNSLPTGPGAAIFRFGGGVIQGIGSTITNVASGLWYAAKTGVTYIVDATAYGSAVEPGSTLDDATVEQLRANVADDFAQAADNLGRGVDTLASALEHPQDTLSKLYNVYKASEAQAAQDGTLPEFYGRFTGQVLAEGGATVLTALDMARGLGLLGEGAGALNVSAETVGGVAGSLETDVLGSPGSLGSMSPPRSPFLGSRASMSELLQSNAVPGSEGVTLLVDSSTSPSSLYGSIFDLSQKNGIEYALTRENGNLVLRSGALDTVRVPQSAELIAHTHPYDPIFGSPQTGPSLRDVNALNGRWSKAVDINPSAERPISDIIWGSEPGQVTPFGATGIDQVADPTKGGIKRGRTWQ